MLELKRLHTSENKDKISSGSHIFQNQLKFPLTFLCRLLESRLQFPSIQDSLLHLYLHLMEEPSPR